MYNFNYIFNRNIYFKTKVVIYLNKINSIENNVGNDSFHILVDLSAKHE